VRADGPLPDCAGGVSIRADIATALTTVRVECHGEEIALRPHEYNEYTRRSRALRGVAGMAGRRTLGRRRREQCGV
jgi:hypothetical protein